METLEELEESYSEAKNKFSDEIIKQASYVVDCMIKYGLNSEQTSMAINHMAEMLRVYEEDYGSPDES